MSAVPALGRGGVTRSGMTVSASRPASTSVCVLAAKERGLTSPSSTEVEMHWIAEERTSDPSHPRWAPTLVDDGLMFSLPILFNTEVDCLQYITKIPSGEWMDSATIRKLRAAHIDGQEATDE